MSDKLQFVEIIFAGNQPIENDKLKFVRTRVDAVLEYLTYDNLPEDISDFQFVHGVVFGIVRHLRPEKYRSDTLAGYARQAE